MNTQIPRRLALALGARLACAAVALAGALLPALAPASAQAATFQVRIDGKAFTYALPGSSAVTLKWAPGDSTASARLTSASATALTRKLEASSVAFGAPSGSTPTVDIDRTKTFQTIDGFGGALTDSAASVINASPKRNDIMNALFASSGARFTFTRLPMGASDFVASPSWKSYDDKPAGQTDPTLASFSIAHDEAYIIPLLKQALTLSPSLKVLATPWSAPGWMKIGSTFAGTCEGSSNYLQNAFYPAYANYFVKFVKAYKASGVPIYMVSLQNEPQHCNSSYATMNMEPGDQAHLASELRPALNAGNLGAVRILGWDHNWVDQNGSPTTYPQQALQCSGGRSNSPIDAVGYHWYNGGESKIAAVQNKFHDDCAGKDVYFTEGTGFAAASNVAGNLVFEMRNGLISPIRNWARASTYWNIALDESHGPHQGGCGDCNGMITVKSDGSFTMNEHYYAWAHFSKFVDPGAVRIDSTGPANTVIETVAFKNPDGTIVLVAMNPASPDSSPPPPPAPPPPPPAACGNPFAWLFGGCSSPPPPPPPPPVSPPPPASPPAPPAAGCNPFAWLFGGTSC